jgi:hypothetical protein
VAGQQILLLVAEEEEFVIWKEAQKEEPKQGLKEEPKKGLKEEPKQEPKQTSPFSILLFVLLQRQ